MKRQPRTIVGTALWATILCVAATAQSTTVGSPKVIQSLDMPFLPACHRFTDITGDRRADLIAIAKTGEVRAFVGAEAPAAVNPEPRGKLALARPERTVLALGDFLGSGRPQLLTLSPDGVIVYPAGDDGAFFSEGKKIALEGTNRLTAPKFNMRLGAPRFADILRDIDRDGKPDLLWPMPSSCEIWLNVAASGEGADPSERRLRKIATIPIEADMTRQKDTGALSDRLVSRLVIPRVDLDDLNGDGRDDLTVEDDKIRLFYMQRADGTLPENPDVRVDLATFTDTTAETKVALGKTVPGLGEQRYYSNDLDADGIPDYVIAHRRKVWVFHGTKDGPQFTQPSTVLKTADDVTLILGADLNADGLVDMVLMKVEVPTAAALLTAFFGDWDVDITALGYLHDRERKYDTLPAKKSVLVVRLPSIPTILKNPQAIISRFVEASQAERRYAEGDFTGDGGDDIALFSRDVDQLEVFCATAPEPTSRSSAADVAWLSDVLFENENKVWDLDRIVEFVANESERKIQSLTARRQKIAPLLLRDGKKFYPVTLGTADTNGDGRAEIVIGYELKDASRATSFDFVGILP